jgi:hypothetical protein
LEVAILIIGDIHRNVVRCSEGNKRDRLDEIETETEYFIEGLLICLKNLRLAWCGYWDESLVELAEEGR